jgi:hypothetical protein
MTKPKPNARRGRPPRLGADQRQVAFRLPGELIERLETYAEWLREDTGMATVSVSDAVRLVLTRGLDEIDSDSRGRRGRPRG